MAENPLGMFLSVLSLGFGGLVLMAGWSSWPLRWLGGIAVMAGIAGLARIAGVV